MTGFALALFARLGLSQRVARVLAPLALALAALALLGALYGLGAWWLHRHDTRVVAADRQAGNLEQLHDQVKADAAAADQRLRDAAANGQQERAYRDAIDNPKAGDAGDPDVRLACEQLRRDGQDTTRLPACGGR